MSEQRLRERGIYRLPDGEEVVVSECGKGEYCLFTMQAWEGFSLAEYFLNKEGHVLKQGTKTGWNIEALQRRSFGCDLIAAVLEPAANVHPRD